jgi:hypothetical protein
MCGQRFGIRQEPLKLFDPEHRSLVLLHKVINLCCL